MTNDKGIIFNITMILTTLDFYYVVCKVNDFFLKMKVVSCIVT